MQQFKVSLPDETLAALRTAGEKSGKTVADEIRDRLARSLEDDQLAKPTRELMATVDQLASLISTQFGHAWYSGPDAFAAFTFGVMGAIGRHKPADDAAPTSERPVRLVASDNPSTIGLGLETLTRTLPAADDPRVRDLMAKSEEQMRKIRGEQS